MENDKIRRISINEMLECIEKNLKEGLPTLIGHPVQAGTTDFFINYCTEKAFWEDIDIIFLYTDTFQLAVLSEIIRTVFEQYQYEAYIIKQDEFIKIFNLGTNSSIALINFSKNGPETLKEYFPNNCNMAILDNFHGTDTQELWLEFFSQNETPFILTSKDFSSSPLYWEKLDNDVKLIIKSTQKIEIPEHVRDQIETIRYYDGQFSGI